MNVNENVKQVESDLRNADSYIERAKKFAEKIPDKGLQEKVQKASTTVKEAQQHITEKKDPQKG
jgi:hypothetical protein